MLHVLTSPLGLGLLGALFARWGPRWSRHVAVGLVAACLLLATPLGANSLVWLIERKLSAGQDCTSPSDGPIVLMAGGFVTRPSSRSDFGSLSLASLRRVGAAVALLAPPSRAGLIVSGGGDEPVITEADVMAELAQQLGIAPGRVVIERQSRTTWASAAELSRLTPALPRQVRLVTSSLHAPRARLALERHGFMVCVHSWESQFIPPSSLGYLLPQSSSLVKAEVALHELIGLAWYRLRAASPAAQPTSAR